VDMCYPEGEINWGDPDGFEASPAVTETRVQAEILAWYTLAQLTGWQIATCPVTIRPCRKSCNAGRYYIAPVTWSPVNGPFSPGIVDGQWVNVWCGHGNTDCSCAFVEEVILPTTAGRIDSVEVDGVTLDASQYRVDNGNRLVRLDGGQWPYCQDMNLPLGEASTFGVTYWPGTPPNPMVNLAASLLAKEFYAALTGAKCALPIGVVQVVRQGVSYQVQRDFFEDGRTGIAGVDAVIAVYNPYRLKRPTIIRSPDRRRPRTPTIGGY